MHGQETDGFDHNPAHELSRALVYLTILLDGDNATILCS